MVYVYVSCEGYVARHKYPQRLDYEPSLVGAFLSFLT